MAQSWPDIASSYERGLSDPGIDSCFRKALVGIWTLAERIRDSELGGQLFGWTSMLDLCIQQTDQPYPFQVYLRISPQLSGDIEFRYHDTQIAKRQWSRIVPAEASIERFELFMEQLRWASSLRSIRPQID